MAVFPPKGLDASQAYERALAMHRRGRIGEAEVLYRAVLHLIPGHSKALQHLGIILTARGETGEAVALLRRAVDLAPPSAAVYNDLGIALDASGRLDEALQCYDAAAALDPGSADPHNNMGVVLAKLGRAEAAIAAYERAIALAPDLASAHGNLANLLAAMGRADDAIARFNIALALAPDRSETHNDLGAVLASSDRQADAIAHFERALAISPDFLSARNNLANALCSVERYGEAVDHFRRVVAQRPDAATEHCRLGYSLRMSNRAEEALQSYERTVALAPANAEAHHGIGLVAQTLGRLDASQKALEKAVELAPGNPSYHRALAEAKRFEENDPQLATMEALASRMATLDEEQRAELHFALGKAYADLGRHEIAFRQFIDGNAIKSRLEHYDESAHLTMMRHIQSVFGAELLRRNAGSGDPSDVPVFILGMPRSGSTLVEQILASHARIFGAGELRYLSEATKSFRGRDVSGFFPEVAASMSAEQLRAFGDGYVRYIRSLAPAADRITDKMPANFRFIGLIRMALPNARIIHTRRNPVDTCLSCFSRLFGKKSFTSDLGTLARYYKAYATLMAHWRRILPDGAMLEVQYEDVVGDFENQARRIVAYCGLPWDERCLTFYQTARPVRTASVTQVRQPIYRDAIGRSKPFESMLEPLLVELGAI
jgi:tetratricopeptide (TPR) repeat protein